MLYSGKRAAEVTDQKIKEFETKFQNNLFELKKIMLYKEPAISEINTKLLTEFLEEKFPIKVEIRNNVFKNSALKISKNYQIFVSQILKIHFQSHKSSAMS